MILGMRLHALWLAAAALLAVCAPAKAEGPTDQSRQVLVMLRMPPEHYRPGSAYAGSYGSAVTQGMAGFKRYITPAQAEDLRAYLISEAKGTPPPAAPAAPTGGGKK